MAIDETLTVTYGRKIQLEQYEPANFSATLEVALAEDDDAAEVYAEREERLEDMVEREIAARVARKKMEDQDDGG